MNDDGRIVVVSKENGEKAKNKPVNEEKRKLKLRSIPFALTCILHKNYILADPTAEEESIMDTLITIVLDTSCQLVSLYKPGGPALAYESVLQVSPQLHFSNTKKQQCTFIKYSNKNCLVLLTLCNNK